MFGAYVDTIHDVRTAPQTYSGMPVTGQFGDLVPTSARVLGRFDSGKPAITEVQLGRGSAVLIGFDAARLCCEPGRQDVEALIARLCRGDAARDWECDAPMAFRLSAPQADHYFLLNDGAARTVIISAHDHRYAAGELVIEQTPIDVGGTIAVSVPAFSGVWVRLQKK